MSAVLDRKTLDNQPLRELDEWDDFVATRYQQGKSEEEFRNYAPDANPRVTEFFRALLADPDTERQAAARIALVNAGLE